MTKVNYLAVAVAALAAIMAASVWYVVFGEQLGDWLLKLLIIAVVISVWRRRTGRVTRNPSSVNPS